MKPDIQRIRELIGENDLEQVIQVLADYLKTSPHHDLLDGLYVQKGEWAEYRRRTFAGTDKTEHLNEIRDNVLQIAREVDRRPENTPMEEKKPPRSEPPPPPSREAVPPPAQYVARCVFNGDMNQYFVTPQGQIVILNPANNFSTMVASRVASMNPAFAWFYMFPNGFYYSIDHNGAIWGLNAFGMPMQMGYVEYL